jgi:outer membrane protein TolC
MRFIYLLLIFATISLNAGLKRVTLNQALSMIDENNLEVKISKFEESMKYYDIQAVKAKSYGSLELTHLALRSNDAGNVFGFKLQSREANFGDFGFSDFLGAFSQGMSNINWNDPNAMQNMMGMFSNPQATQALLKIEPKDLNYPKPRSHFLTKLTYKLPIYTGGMLSEYRKITQKLYDMSKLDTKKVLNLKRFEVKKTFYDISLVNNFIYNLTKIKRNIKKLERVIKEMQKEGYAVETDYLEVDSRLAEVEAMLEEAKLNRELAYHFLSFLINAKVDSVVAPKRAPKPPRITKEIVEARSLDIAKAKLGLTITKHAIEVEKAKFKPQVGAFAEYGFADNQMIPKHISKKDFWTIGVQAKWNIFNGGADKASLEKAKLNYLKVATQVKLAKKGIWLKASKLRSEIRSLQGRVISYQKQYKFANRVYQTYKEKYKMGVVSITDLLIKQSKQIEMLMKLLKIKNDRNAKILELQNVING